MSSGSGNGVTTRSSRSGRRPASVSIARPRSSASSCCAQTAGARVIYLGPDLPVAGLALAARRSAADVIGLSAVNAVRKAAFADLEELRRTLPRHVDIWVGGRGWADVAMPPGVRFIATLDELRQRVLRLAKKSWLQP